MFPSPRGPGVVGGDPGYRQFQPIIGQWAAALVRFSGPFPRQEIHGTHVISYTISQSSTAQIGRSIARGGRKVGKKGKCSSMPSKTCVPSRSISHLHRVSLNCKKGTVRKQVKALNWPLEPSFPLLHISLPSMSP